MSFRTVMRYVTAVAVVSIVASGTVLVQSAPAYADRVYVPRVGTPWYITFQDEFNGTELDRTKWTTAYPWGRSLPTNGELQWYADDAFEFTGTTLRIRADKRSVQPGYNYTSGMIASYNSFDQRYGYFEMRAKLPRGQGLWPAFWMMASTKYGLIWPPELDIAEARGSEPNRVIMVCHYKDAAGQHAYVPVFSYVGPDFSQDFHTFGLEWAPGILIWTIDGIERARWQGPEVPSISMYVIANVAIGGIWAGAPDQSTPFPSYFEIDYIRVYKMSGAPEVL